MARFSLGVLTGMAIMTIAGAALGIRAMDPVTDVQQAAVAAGVDPVELAGAANTVGVDVWVYARSEGLLEHASTAAPSKPPPVVASSPRIECIIRVESKGDPLAHNRSGASGLGQFLPSTWRTTPQGQAGLSVWDPAANRAAINWMISVGRAREFDAVRFYGC